jgi:hypothetical protein
VIYRPGEKNTKTDVLSRRWDHALKEGSEASPVSFSTLFRSPSGSEGFRSPSGSDEKRRRRPSGFDRQDYRDSERVFEDTTDGIVVWSLMFKLSAAAGRHSHPSAPMQTCGWC